MVSPYHANLREDVFPLLSDQVGRVLDLGGGIGVTAGELRRLGRADDATVVDLLEEQSDPDVDRLFRGDLEDSDFLDNVVGAAAPFDTILCLDVLEHLRDPWDVVTRLERMLAPGGVIVASVPNLRFVSVLVPLVVFGRFEYRDMGVMDRTHLRWFTRRSAISMLTGPGLKFEAVKLNIGRRSRFFNALTLGLLKDFFAYQILVRVRKHGEGCC